jgi:leucyl-tRNA synthetase
VNVKCPKCGGKAEREVDTMDTFVDSSWYFLRYPSAASGDKPFDKDMTKYWLPVDMYIGGPEHACMHLLYARFITMVLHDMGHIDFDEPFKRLVHQGMITKDGAKMSKSKGNVVSPDQFVEKYGSDVFRMYLMFMGPFTEGGDWNDQGITGIARFVERFYLLMHSRDLVSHKAELDRAVHKTIKKVTEDIENFQFNTAVAALMEFVNTANKTGIDLESQLLMVRLIAPLAPHLAEEMWEKLGQPFSIFNHSWPAYDPQLLVETRLALPVQVNGKLRGQIEVAVGESKENILALARADAGVMRHLEGKTVVKEIYVPGKLVSLVVKD